MAAGAEMLELRTDYLEGLNVDLVKKLIAEVRSSTGQKLPIIGTCRDKQQAVRWLTHSSYESTCSLPH